MEIFGSCENLYFPKNLFSKTLHQIQKQDILLKHSVYGYDPLHNQDEISMFLALSINLVLVERCKHEYQKPNSILSQRKIFSKLKNLL